MVRQMMYAQYREEAYTRGPERGDDHRFRRSGRGVSRGAQGRDGLRASARVSRAGRLHRSARGSPTTASRPSTTRLLDHPDNGEIVAAVVTDGESEAGEGELHRRQRGDRSTATACASSPSALSTRAQPNQRIRPGAIVRLIAERRRQLVDHAVAAGGRRVRLARAAGRRDPRAGRRLRLQQEQVQPRHAGVAPAGFELQAVHLFGVARKGLGTGDHHQRRAALLQRRRDRAARRGSRRTTTAASMAR